MPIHVISTYAPHNRYADETKQHWDDVHGDIGKNVQRRLIKWGEDANGQLGDNDKTEEENTPKKSSMGET